MSARILSGAPCCMLFLRQRFLQPVVGSLVVLGFGAIALAQTTATTTRLVVSPSTSPVASKTVVTLTATVVAGATPVHPGMVTFCDTSLTTVPRGAPCASLAVMGTAQLTSTGTAVLKFVPGPGNHSYSAIFAGTTTYIKSNSTAQALTVTGSYATGTVISPSGSAGNYTLMATVAGPGSFTLTPMGNVSFRDTTNSNSVLGTVALGAATLVQHFDNAPGSPIAADSAPNGVAIADFNDDGIPDIAVANIGSDNVTVLLGNGSGGFTTAPGSPFAVSVGPYSVAVGDFNGDGAADLVTANFYDNTASILLGNGSGGFTTTPGSPIAAGTQPVSVVVGDFNGDGIADLALTNFNANTVSVLLGNGSGGFTAAPGSPVAVGNGPLFMALEDFNGDGIADLVTANGLSDNASILLGNGSGGFTAAPGSPVAVGSFPNAPAVGDFNGDGIADLAVANYTSSDASILLGNGSGGFTAAAASPVAVGNGPIFMTVGDFNGDGITDLVTTNINDNTVSILVGNGSGGFTAAPESPVAVGGGPSYVGVGDLNGDGITDLVTANGEDSTVSVLLNQVTQTATALLTAVSIPGSGTHNVDASYPGNTNFSSSISPTTPLTATKVPTTLAVTSAPTSSTYGQQVVLTATLTINTSPSVPSTDGQTVAFYNGATVIGTGTLSSGIATINVTTLPVSTDNLTAVYAGDTYLVASTSPSLPFVVSKATPVITWTNPAAIPYGTGLSTTQLSATANVPGPFAYSPAPGAVLNAGTQTLNVTLTPTDTTNYTTATKSVTLIVTKAVLTVTANSASRTYGAANPAFTDTIAGFVNGDTQASALIGTASLTTATTPTSPAGTYPITATLGTLVAANYSFIFVNGVLTVTKATPGSGGTPPVTTTSSLNPAPAGSPIVLTATVPPGATGSVSFYDGTTLLGTGTISGGEASFTISTLAPGTHSITPVYAGDSNFNGATSAVLSQVVQSAASASDFATASATGPQLIPPGASASYNIVISPVNGAFNNVVTLTATNLPPGASYTYAPATVTPGTAGATSNFTVSVPKQTAALGRSGRNSLLLAVLLLPLTATRRTRGKPPRLLLWLLLGLTSLSAISGCGAGGYFSQPQRTYTITVTGTSGTLVRNTTVTLTVE